MISAGEPGKWKEVATYDCGAYLAWAEVKLDVTTRYLRITRKTPGANFSEIAVYEYSQEAYQAMLARKAEEARREAERQAALKKRVKKRSAARWWTSPLTERCRWSMKSFVPPNPAIAASPSRRPRGARSKRSWAAKLASCRRPRARRPTSLTAWAS